MSITLRIALLTLVVSTGMAETSSTELTVTKARIDFKKKAGRDTLQLRLAFGPDVFSPTLRPDEATLAVTIGPETVISLPNSDPRGRWRVKERRGVYEYRLRRAKGHPDTLNLKVNVAEGVLKLNADRLDLSDVQGEGPDSVAITMTVGGVTWSDTVKMGQKELRWRFRYTTKGKVNPKGPPGGIGGGGGGGGGLPGEGPVSIRTLNQGGTYAPTNFGTMVLRTDQEYLAEWLKRYPPPPPGSKAPVMVRPPVDFTKEMVVIIDLGSRPTLGYRVFATGAAAVGTGLRIDWLEGQPGANCFVGQAVASPFVIAAVSLRDGPVTFSGRVQTINCQ